MVLERLPTICLLILLFVGCGGESKDEKKKSKFRGKTPEEIAAVKYEWRKYESEKGGFSVDIPKSDFETVQDDEVTNMIVVAEGGYIFMAACYNKNKAYRFATPNDYLEKLKSTGMFELVGEPVEIEVNGHKGLEFQMLKGRRDRQRHQVFSIGERFYEFYIEYSMRNLRREQDEKRFFESVVIVR